MPFQKSLLIYLLIAYQRKKGSLQLMQLGCNIFFPFDRVVVIILFIYVKTTF